MEVIWKCKETFLTSKVLVKMEMKLYGSHMEMEENLSVIKNISLDGNKTVWKSYRKKKTFLTSKI